MMVITHHLLILIFSLNHPVYIIIKLNKSIKGENGAVIPKNKVLNPLRLQKIIVERATRQSLIIVVYLIFK